MKPIDTEIARLRGWRYAAFWLFVAVHEVISYTPVLMLRKNRNILREKAACCDLVNAAFEARGKEIERLQKLFWVNMQRHGHSSTDIGEVLGEVHVIGERAAPNKLVEPAAGEE